MTATHWGFLMGDRERTIMNRSLATALAVGAVLLAGTTFTRPAAAQGAQQCADSFTKLREDAQKKALAVQTAGKNRADRKEMCALVTKFYSAEALVVKYLADNKTWCGVPDDAISASKKNHEATLKFRDTVCAEGPKPKAPSLSEAIGMPTLDTEKNTKTGRGTFDTLTGNPLAK
jgi:hypothetical protein